MIDCKGRAKCDQTHISMGQLLEANREAITALRAENERLREALERVNNYMNKALAKQEKCHHCQGRGHLDCNGDNIECRVCQGDGVVK